MKKIAVLGICLCLFPYCTMTAFAEDAPSEQKNEVTISVSIPEQYKITVVASEGIEASLNNGATSTIIVDRFGEFDLKIELKQGYRLLQVLLNGKDITNQLVNMNYHVKSVYENMVFQVITEPIMYETTTSITSQDNVTRITTSDAMSTTGSADSKTYLKNNSPKTGDIAQVEIWSALILAFSVLAIIARRKSNDN